MPERDDPSFGGHPESYDKKFPEKNCTGTRTEEMVLPGDERQSL